MTTQQKQPVQKLIQKVLERLAIPLRYRRQDKALQEVIQLQARRLPADLAGKSRHRPDMGLW